MPGSRFSWCADQQFTDWTSPTPFERKHAKRLSGLVVRFGVDEETLDRTVSHPLELHGNSMSTPNSKNVYPPSPPMAVEDFELLQAHFQELARSHNATVLREEEDDSCSTLADSEEDEPIKTLTPDRLLTAQVEFDRARGQLRRSLNDCCSALKRVLATGCSLVWAYLKSRPGTTAATTIALIAVLVIPLTSSELPQLADDSTDKMPIIPASAQSTLNLPGLPAITLTGLPEIRALNRLSKVPSQQPLFDKGSPWPKTSLVQIPTSTALVLTGGSSGAAGLL